MWNKLTNMRGSEKPTETFVVVVSFFLYKGKKLNERVSKAKASQTSCTLIRTFQLSTLVLQSIKTTATSRLKKKKKKKVPRDPWKFKKTRNLKSAMTLHHFTSSPLLVKSTCEMQLLKNKQPCTFPPLCKSHNKLKGKDCEQETCVSCCACPPCKTLLPGFSAASVLPVNPVKSLPPAVNLCWLLCSHCGQLASPLLRVFNKVKHLTIYKCKLGLIAPWFHHLVLGETFSC